MQWLNTVAFIVVLVWLSVLTIHILHLHNAHTRLFNMVGQMASNSNALAVAIKWILSTDKASK